MKPRKSRRLWCFRAKCLATFLITTVFLANNISAQVLQKINAFGYEYKALQTDIISIPPSKGAADTALTAAYKAILKPGAWIYDSVNHARWVWYNGRFNMEATGAAQIQSDWAQTNPASVDFINNKPILAAVAFTGNFFDLSGIPTTLAGYGITDAVPSNRTITINGVPFDLSTNRSWTVSNGGNTLDSVLYNGDTAYKKEIFVTWNTSAEAFSAGFARGFFHLNPDSVNGFMSVGDVNGNRTGLFLIMSQKSVGIRADSGFQIGAGGGAQFSVLKTQAAQTGGGFLQRLYIPFTGHLLDTLATLSDVRTGAVAPQGIDDVLARLQQLTADRKFRMGLHNLILDSGTLKFTNSRNPAILLDPLPTNVHSVQYILRAHTASTTNNGSFEMVIDNNTNGGPPDDNIFAQGWNYDSQTDNTLNSFTTRMEYMFQGGNYEYHLQWSTPGASRLYRLMSFTFRDHGSTATDENLLFFLVSGLEARNLAGTTFFSVSNNVVGAADVATMALTNRAGTKQVGFNVDDANNAVNISQNSGTMPLNFNNWTGYNFQYQTTGGPQLNTYWLNTGTFNGAFLTSTATSVIIENPVVYSQGDYALLSFTPSAGAGAVRGTVGVHQGIGAMIYAVQGGGYFHRWDLGGVTDMTLTTSALTVGVPIFSPASTTAAAGFRVPAGTAPTSPTNGDVYQDGTHAFMRIGGAWKQLD